MREERLPADRQGTARLGRPVWSARPQGFNPFLANSKWWQSSEIGFHEQKRCGEAVAETKKSVTATDGPAT